MAVSIYDTPAQANFINTYVPIPFQEIVQAGTARQQRYDTQVAGLEQALMESELLRSMPGADTAFIQQQQAKMKEIAEGFSKRDLSDPFISKDLRDTLRKEINRGGIYKVQESYQGYKRFLDEYAKQKAAGLALPMEDLSGWNTMAEGVFSNLPVQRLDYAGTMQQVFGNLDYKSGVGESKGIPGVWSTITEKDVRMRAQTAGQEFLNTPAGQQYVQQKKIAGDNRDDLIIASEFAKYVGMSQLGSRFSPLPVGYLKTGDDGKGPLVKPIYSEMNFAGEAVSKSIQSWRQAEKVVRNGDRELRNLQTQLQRMTDGSIPANTAGIQAVKDQIEKTTHDMAYAKNFLQHAEDESTGNYAKDLDYLRDATFNKLVHESQDPVSPLYGMDISELLDKIEEYHDQDMIRGRFAGAASNKAGEEFFYALLNRKQQWDNLRGLDKEHFKDVVYDYIKGIKKIDNQFEQDVHSYYDENAKKTITSSYIAIPDLIHISGVKKGESSSLRTASGDLLPSGIGNLLGAVKYDRSGVKIEAAPGTEDKGLKKFKEAADFAIVGLSNPSDKGGNYLVIGALDTEGNPTQDLYKLYTTTPTQKEAVINDMINARQADLAFRWYYSDLYDRIWEGFSESGSFSLNFPDNEVVVLNHQWEGNRDVYSMEIKTVDGRIVQSPRVYYKTEEIFADLLELLKP